MSCRKDIRWVILLTIFLLLWARVSLFSALRLRAIVFFAIAFVRLSFDFISVVVVVVIRWFLRVDGCLPSFTISSSCFFYFASCNLVSGSTPDGYIEESIFCSWFFLFFAFGLAVVRGGKPDLSFSYVCMLNSQDIANVVRHLMFAVSVVCICVRKQAIERADERTGAHLQILWLFFRPCSHNWHSATKDWH